MNRKLFYKDFIETKRKKIENVGFDIREKEYNKNLFDFQRFILTQAIKRGRFAIFADCGLGKTIIQLNWAEIIKNRFNKPVLILAPLAVSEQTIEEGKKFDIEIFRLTDYQNIENNIYITNYENLDKVDCSKFVGVVLDESSILKNYTGKTKTLIIDSFANTQYKLACTATPSPNDFMEIGNHSEFLNVISRGEMLSKYFVHDGGNTSKYRVKRHAIKDFYNWICQWAIMIGKPSDVGFDDDGFILPELKFIEQTVITPKKDNGELFNNKAVNATGFNQELRITMIQRAESVFTGSVCKNLYDLLIA